MNKPSFVYVTYIATTAEKAWNALIDPELTERYWAHHHNVSDWKPGSAWQMIDRSDDDCVDIEGIVLENDAPRRLVVSWAYPRDAANPAAHSRVTYQIEPIGDIVKLTVTHDDLEPDSPMLRGISDGWPVVLSNLKTLLETGERLPSSEQLWNRNANAAAT